MSEHGPFSQPTQEPAPSGQQQPLGRQRSRRTVAVLAATALVTGVGGIGAGYGAAHLSWPHSSSSTESTNASAPAQQGTTYGGSESSSDEPQDGDGFGDWQHSLPQ